MRVYILMSGKWFSLSSSEAEGFLNDVEKQLKENGAFGLRDVLEQGGYQRLKSRPRVVRKTSSRAGYRNFQAESPHVVWDPLDWDLSDVDAARKRLRRK